MALSVEARQERLGRRGLAIWRQARRAPLFPSLALLLVVLAAIFGPLVSPNDPNAGDLSKALQPPAWQSGGSAALPLGTDAVGRDILSRLIWGARISVLVAVVATAVGSSVGVPLGLIAGYYGGKVDSLIMRLTDVMLAMPIILVAITIVAIFRPSLMNVILVISLGIWAGYARIVRGEVLSLKERDFVALARVAGASPGHIMARHILPNVFNTIIILATLNVGTVILFEAALSYLGLGVPARTPTWGAMVNDGHQYLSVAWWITTIPGLAIVFTVLGANLMGDWLRDALDPKRRQV
ncbi:MAG: ABC transporter permease [Chloroflexi bacterium]|nr:ABC transporter permease [Chloroflexota bacterium]